VNGYPAAAAGTERDAKHLMLLPRTVAGFRQGETVAIVRHHHRLPQQLPEIRLQRAAIDDLNIGF
jgi:hypothetical protein